LGAFRRWLGLEGVAQQEDRKRLGGGWIQFHLE